MNNSMKQGHNKSRAKGCPFCGSGKVSDMEMDRVDRMYVRRIWCGDCGACGPVVRSNQVEHAVESWNWRDSFPANLSCVLRGLINPWLSYRTGSPEICDATCCPFCSSEKIAIAFIDDETWCLWCVDCECEGPWDSESFETREGSLRRWNQRVKFTEK